MVNHPLKLRGSAQHTMANHTQIAPATRELAELFKQPPPRGAFDAAKDEQRVKINEAVGKMAYVYEKIRNAIDYQEEHLIRKNSIGRMLKRRIRSRERGDMIAEPLIRELIRAGYIKNDAFPARRITDVENIINKYTALIHHTIGHEGLFTEKNKTFNWIISVASSEIEEYLSPTTEDDAAVEAMFKIFRPFVDVRKEIAHPEDQDIQVYLAIHRALIKSDQAILRYHMLYYYAPEWKTIAAEDIPSFAKMLPELIIRIEKQRNNKQSDRLFRYMKKYAPLFTILKDVLDQNRGAIDELLSDPHKLSLAVKAASQARYTQASTKLSRGVLRSIIYIFLTKTLMAYVLELPYEALFLDEIKLMPLAINVLFHPLLMFFIATSIRVPAVKNTERINQGIYEIVYNPPEKEVLTKREELLKRSPFLNFLFTTLYFTTFIVTFGSIIWLLNKLEFSFVSGLLFVFFLSVISFFGLHLRNNATELVVISKRQGIIILTFEFFTLPVLRAGRWIARKTSKVNIFMYIMDFIIEAPFKVLLETIEDWLAFQRQKKEELM